MNQELLLQIVYMSDKKEGKQERALPVESDLNVFERTCLESHVLLLEDLKFQSTQSRAFQLGRY